MASQNRKQWKLKVKNKQNVLTLDNILDQVVFDLSFCLINQVQCKFSARKTNHA